MTPLKSRTPHDWQDIKVQLKLEILERPMRGFVLWASCGHYRPKGESEEFLAMARAASNKSKVVLEPAPASSSETESSGISVRIF